jgi:hypothetical protein
MQKVHMLHESDLWSNSSSESVTALWEKMNDEQDNN